MSEEVKKETIDSLSQEHANLAHRLGIVEYQLSVLPDEKNEIISKLVDINKRGAELKKTAAKEEPRKVEGEVVQ